MRGDSDANIDVFVEEKQGRMYVLDMIVNVGINGD